MALCHGAQANFAKYVPITVSGYTGAEMTEYPVLVKIDSTRIPNVYSVVKNSGADLKFTDSEGEGDYPYEVDLWNPSGVSYVWVKLPSFKSGTAFRMYYGDGSKTTNPSATQVWSDYDLVCHVTGTAKDSSPNDFTGILHASGRSVSDGKVGLAYGMASTGIGPAMINGIYESGQANKGLADDVFTASCWIRYNVAPSAWQALFGPKNNQSANAWGVVCAAANGTLTYIQSAKDNGQSYSTTGKFPVGTWVKVDAVYNGPSVALYINGELIGSKSVTLGASLCWVYWMAWGGPTGNGVTGSTGSESQSLAADFDECRIYGGAANDDRIAADYAVVTKDDIFSFGTPESGYDVHKNRVMDISATEQVTVFCEAGYYQWTPPANACDFKLLVVGPGGGGANGGNNSGGGGGGGEVIYVANPQLYPFHTYSLRVAPGGVGAPGNAAGTQAQPSHFFGDDFEQVTAMGGGGGSGNWGSIAGCNGASGGGGGGPNAGGAGGQALAAGGHAGGAGAGNNKGGGGGGMSEPGYAGNAAENRGNGGAGVVYDITGEDVMYGHGGGGYGAKSGRYAFSGGPNGYGDGNNSPGEDGTGGGGGGGGAGVPGGTGTVIIRYTVQSFPASVTVGVSTSANASEAGFVAGGFTFTCSDSARNVNFPVHYKVSGTAKMGQTFETLYGAAVIPAGETSVTIPVKPLSDSVTDEDTTVIVTIVPDDIYTIGSNGSATLVIANDPSTVSDYVRYVAVDGDDANDGQTVATAYKSLRKAVHDFDTRSHGTVYVLPGTHKLSGYDNDNNTVIGYTCAYVTNAVRIIGCGATPADTVLTRDSATGTGSARRILYLNHPHAEVRNLTVDKGALTGLSSNSSAFGGNIHIGKNGGLVEDCIISNGKDDHWQGGGCNIHMKAGRVSRCVITGGTGSNNRNPFSDDYNYHGTAVYATGGLVENCLIYGNGVNTVGGNNNGTTVGLYGFARIVNCTITDNYSDYSAGVSVRTKDCVVQNCAIYNNHALQPATVHSDVWVSYGNDDSYSTDFTGCISDQQIDSRNIQTDTIGFVDPLNHDYHLTVASACRDKAVGYVTSGAISLTDLDGNPRRMGSCEDVGCYEYDPAQLGCDFYADKPVTLMDEAHSGTTIKFTAIVEGEYTGTLTYHWDFDGDGVYEITTMQNPYNKKYSDYGTTGYYTVGLKVTAGTAVSTMTKTDYIHLAPPNVYASPDSTGGTFPYNTPEKAAKNLTTALSVTLDGSVVHMAQGTYSYHPVQGTPQIDYAVSVIGETDNPYDTVIDCPDSVANKNGMLLMLNNADSFVANICFQGGRNESDGNMAAGIRISGNGGTVSNCVVRHCWVTGGASHGGVWMSNGLLTHCIIEDNEIRNVREADGFNGGGNTRREAGVYIGGNGGRIENCLFRNIRTGGCLIILDHPNAIVRNCTIIDCEVGFWTDNPGSHPNRMEWPAAAIESTKNWAHGPYGKVYNTVIANVTRHSYHDNNNDITFPEVTSAADPSVAYIYDYGWIKDDCTGTFVMDPGYCENCASDYVLSPFSPTSYKMTTADFVNYAAGDLTPKIGGALNDNGQSISGWAKICDLAGMPRIVNDIDIGCYEQQGGATIKKYYVDCLFTGVSTGKKEAPFKTIQEGCSNATQLASCVYVRGGPDRVYSFATYADAARIGTDSNQVVGCDAEWNPATSFTATNSMAIIAIADDYASKSRTAYKSSGWPAPITVAASDCRISGFYSEFGKDSYKAQDKGGEGLISIKGNCSGTIIENCWFRMKGAESSYSAVGTGGVISGLKANGAAAAQVKNTVIRNCYVRMAKYRAAVCLFYDLHGGTRVENCFVENLDTLYGGDNDNLKTIDYYVISNIFRNCSNGYKTTGYISWFFANAGNYAPNSGEIAYNRFIHDAEDGISDRYHLFQHGEHYGGSWSSPETYIHHNTIVGYEVAIEAASNTYMWNPKIFDNLIINTGSMFIENATAKWKNGAVDCMSSFMPGSTCYNNAILCDDFVSGTATSQSWYDIGENLAGTNTTIYLAAMPVFVNTHDPLSENYYKMKVPQNTWVINAWTGNDPAVQEFPRYIGAVAPQPGGFAVRIR